MSHLRPCSACARHVRAHATACPFCEAVLAIDTRSPALPVERLGRAARMALGGAAAMALSVAGCEPNASTVPPPTLTSPEGGTPPPPPTVTATPPPPNHSNMNKPYGAPPADGYDVYEV
jgi:hypothetical protein